MLLNEPNIVPIRKGPPRAQDATLPFPATANAYDMTTEDDIGDALTLLAASGDAISMYPAGSRDALMGRILSVDPELPHFVLELNDGVVLPPGDITFVAWLRTAKLQFRLSSAKWKTTPGQPHLVPMVFPEACAVLNRRSSERVESPLGANFTAAFVMNGTPYELPVYDFAVGGIGLRGNKGDAKGLLRGRKLRDVVLELGSETVHVEEMEICATRSYRSFLLGEQLHIGCKFTSVAPKVESQIHSLMNRIGAKR
ncbi:PilZ domain-containing protein [Pseudoduganella sp.]|uniref:PilZ domain-containing protein n=1 Tax=Pseudoduganella sp. TaxID=1880898 RepID=UPI0035AFEAF4